MSRFQRGGVSLARQAFTAYGKSEVLKAGMLVDADVLGERRTLAEWIFEPLEMRSPMKPARYRIRVHGVIFCVAALFGVILFGFNFIQRAQLFPVTIFLIAFGEVVLVSTRYCVPVLDERISATDQESGG
ncbi:hypothetical protein LJR125_002929 [Pseudoxanthomonas sp. LjRoot125]